MCQDTHLRECRCKVIADGILGYLLFILRTSLKNSTNITSQSVIIEKIQSILTNLNLSLFRISIKEPITSIKDALQTSDFVPYTIIFSAYKIKLGSLKDGRKLC